jgi:hypothetical protein
MNDADLIIQSLLQYILKLKSSNSQDPRIEHARAILRNIRKGK